MSEERQPPQALVAGLEAVIAEAAGHGGELAVAVRHLGRGERYGWRDAEPYPAASTIKVLILAALYEAAAEGRVRLDERVALRAEQQVTGSGVLQVLSPGTRLYLRDLAELMIVVSDNAATNMILERIGLERVNALAARLGLRGTQLLRPLQVIPAGASGTNTTTAADLAELLSLLGRGQVVSWDACRRMIATLKRQQINDALPAQLPDPRPGGLIGELPAWELAHKTGGIRGYQHDCGLLYLPGQVIVIAVLTAHCGPPEQARALIARVGRLVWEAYSA